MKALSIALTAVLLAGSAAPAAAQAGAAPPLSLEHRMLLRCSAAFAVVAHRQETGDPSARQYPPLKDRGGEFFVRASARVMDQAGLDRDQLTAALRSEAQALSQAGALDAVMPACLSALEAARL